MKTRTTLVGKWVNVCLFSFVAFCNSVHADLIPVTILHTNDLHSHFREERTPLGLGGIARLKTAADRIRAKNPNTLLVDGGDWSEGDIYYTLESELGVNQSQSLSDLKGTYRATVGSEVVKMMDLLGYDAAVVGNHDWLNGPDTLLDTIEAVHPKTSFISANMDTSSYERGEEFKALITPYVIKEVGGVKIAFIGISTYEFIYDRLLEPVTIFEPFTIAGKLSKKLKESHQADVVVGLSHNSIFLNRTLLSLAPHIDFIVGAHDHIELTKPVEVGWFPFRGSTGWVVEAGCWGRFLGQVDLTVDSESRKVSLVHSQLIQMDSSVPSDLNVLAAVEKLENTLEERHGPIFHDHIGDSEIDITRNGTENFIGNLVTDAYLAHTRSEFQADFAMDSHKFIYGEIYRGPIRTVDVYNANPAVFNAQTQKTWTVRVIPMKGRIISALFNLLYAINDVASFGLLSVSGAHLTYDPWFKKPTLHEFYHDISVMFKSVLGLIEAPAFSGIDHITIQGSPIHPNHTYRVATGGGMVEGIYFINKHFPNFIPLEGMVDTGLENWRVLGNHIRLQSPLNEEKIPIGNRIQTAQSNLGVYSHLISWAPIEKTPNGVLADVTVRIKNYGASSSRHGNFFSGPKVRLLYNKHSTQVNLEPKYIELGAAQSLQKLNPNESVEMIWNNVEIPEQLGRYQVTARVEGNDTDSDHTNDEATRWLDFTDGA